MYRSAPAFHLLYTNYMLTFNGANACIYIQSPATWAHIWCQFLQMIRVIYHPLLWCGSPHCYSTHSAISAPSTIRVWMMPSRLFPLLTAFTQQLWSPSVKWVSVPSSTNSPCRCKGINSSAQGIPHCIYHAFTITNVHVFYLQILYCRTITPLT